MLRLLKKKKLARRQFGGKEKRRGERRQRKPPSETAELWEELDRLSQLGMPNVRSGRDRRKPESKKN
ncbi:MAG: hypothetical protein AB1349_13170 [Elusimicrobiota bacterium]